MSAAEGREASGGRFGPSGASTGAGPDQGQATRSGAAPSGQAGGPSGRPRFPSFGTAPQRSDSTTLPPPPASARFPDTPPSVIRDRSDSQSGTSSGSSGRVRGSGASDEGSAGTNRPYRLTAPGRADTQAGGSSETVGRPFRLPTPRRTGAPDENASETTARLRPIPAEPSPAETAESFGRPDIPGAPGTSAMSSASRPGAVRPGAPPRPTREPQTGAAAGSGSDAAASTAGRGIRLPSTPDRQPHAAPPSPHGRQSHGAQSSARDRQPHLAPPSPADRQSHTAPPSPADRQSHTAPPSPADRQSHTAPPSPHERQSHGAQSSARDRQSHTAPPSPPHVSPNPPSPRPAPETTPVAPDPALSWSAPLAPGGMPGATRPVVSFGEPEGYDGDARPRPLGRRGRSQAVAAAVCLVLGLGLISGAVTGSWLVGDSGGEGSRSTFTAAGGLWHSVPVDQLFPPTVQGQGAGPGGADRTWTRIAVAPDSGCKDAFDPLLRKALAPVGCERLLRATYTDATESYVTTVGLLFTTADAPGMASLANRFRKERLDRRSDLMPLPYAAQGTPAAQFGARQRAAWTVSVLTEAPVVVYAVSGWADGRTVDDPQPAGDAMESGATTAPAQAGLGYEAKGLADRVERGLRKNVRSATEQPS
ncbi:hypothetical protein [Streptomyces sp. NPDC006355]|uniref:hypothetical protein n=1 Tax=Streptomyces sp. NPDC006355 TaxID=3156758 RepID=UPI00339F3CF5